MAKEVFFTPELFRFLRQLAKNNDRKWFEENKQRYLDHVRDPMLRFIEALRPRLEKISPHLVADSRPVGGSLFRVHRDTRFSKDKSPYKTYAAARFKHRKGSRQVTAPGFYLSLHPDGAHAAGGVWRPDGPATAAIRHAIVEHTTDWQRVNAAKAFTSGFLQKGGETLKRPPRGVDAEHPCVEDLRRKDFYVWTDLGEATACSPDFLSEYVKFCRTTSRYVGFLARALDQPF